ncbi:MAG: hypothetical protein ACTSVB_07910 [Candidatus Heimdallarchaeaceae archaeon]
MVNKEDCKKVLDFIPASPKMIGFYDLKGLLSPDLYRDLNDILEQLISENLIIQPKKWWYQKVEKGFEDKTKKHEIPLVKTKFRLSKDKRYFITDTIITDIKPISYIKKVIK